MKPDPNTQNNRQGGRPKVEAPKTHRIVSWLNDEDYNETVARQKQSGKTMSDFIRQAVLSVRIVVRPRVTPEELQAYKDLNKTVAPIAHNLSELAKYSKFGLFSNKRAELHSSIEALKSTVKDFETKLMKK